MHHNVRAGTDLSELPFPIARFSIRGWDEATMRAFAGHCDTMDY
jgi:hypothetical protein